MKRYSEDITINEINSILEKTRNRINKLRTEKGISQKTVADALKQERTCYTKFENGSTDIKLSLLIKLAVIFGTNISYLVGESPSKGFPKEEDIDKKILIVKEVVRRRLKKLRDKNKYNHVRMGYVINADRTTYGRIENGSTDAKLFDLIRIAAFLHTDISYLVGESDER